MAIETRNHPDYEYHPCSRCGRLKWDGEWCECVTPEEREASDRLRRGGEPHTDYTYSYPRVEFYGMNVETLDVGEKHVANVSTSADWREMQMVRRYVRPTDRVLVAGSGRGSSLALIATIVGVDNCIGYEASPDAVSMVRHHVRVDGRQLQVINAAVVAEVTDDSRPFYVSTEIPVSSSFDFSHAAGNAQPVHVPHIPINEALERHNCTVLLLDVEGEEHSILPVLDYGRLRLLICEVHSYDWGETFAALCSLPEGMKTLDLACPPEGAVIAAAWE